MFNPFLHSGYVKVFGRQLETPDPKPDPSKMPPSSDASLLYSEHHASDLVLTTQAAPPDDETSNRRPDPPQTPGLLRSGIIVVTDIPPSDPNKQPSNKSLSGETGHLNFEKKTPAT